MTKEISMILAGRSSKDFFNAVSKLVDFLDLVTVWHLGGLGSIILLLSVAVICPRFWELQNTNRTKSNKQFPAAEFGPEL